MLELKNKKVLVMGLGLYEEGSGIAAVRFLLSQGAKVTVTDLKTREQLADQIKRLGSAAKKIKFVLGEHREADFIAADMVVRNPGVPKSSKYLKIARDRRIPIESDISLFFQLIDRKRIIAVTGTRGKSTTTTLLYEMIKAADSRATLGGNITKSPLMQLAQVKKGGPVILELSSWLLESLDEIRMSPHIAVFTNIYPDHLNTYDGIEDYAAAKKSIFKYQNAQDYCVLNRDNGYTRKMGRELPGARLWFSKKYFKEENGAYIKSGMIFARLDGRETKIMRVADIGLPGTHNLDNYLGAICAAMVYGVKPSVIASAAKKFKGVPNRLELIREIRGVRYYNDTTSTTPEAGLAALEALSGKSAGKSTGKPTGKSAGKAAVTAVSKSAARKIILIAGGSDKGLDFSRLAKEIKKKCKAVVLFDSSGTKRLKPLIEAKNLPLTLVEKMSDAVGIAESQAEKGDIILLSPACASFGLFKNEFDRGEQFRRAVDCLK